MPNLYSLSTVLLLKHYNQDYLLHALRTDFTGSNGVGKSIIADLFQIIFVADTRYIKFATEGIDKKKRRIEKLPYESGIGYAFFNVQVDEGAYLTIGVAIFSNGGQTIKPFIVTSSIELEKGKLEQHTYTADKLLFSSNFLKPNREPYMPDELSGILPDKYGLYLHYFSTKEERVDYYNWLYKHELLPINLAREGNLKAYAKVIQSFSKSKAIDIDSSKSLIEYLFEEDEVEINLEYQQQEQTIKKLLHQFKTTKEQISDISDKQTDLRRLKEYEGERNEADYQLSTATYIQAYQNKIKKQEESDKLSAVLSGKASRLKILKEDSEHLLQTVHEASSIVQREHKAFTDLAGKQILFAKLKELRDEEQSLRDIDTEGILDETFADRTVELLKQDARYYKENIERSRAVLQRYNTMKVLLQKKEQQDGWLKEKLKDVDDKETQLNKFKNALNDVAHNNLFTRALSTVNDLSKVQQTVLMHLRDVALNKPAAAAEGTRYAESIDQILNLDVTEDKANQGWWLHTGALHEFVPIRSALLPDLSNIPFNSLEQLKVYLDKESKALEVQKNIYTNLQKGIEVAGFAEYDFDIDLSDPTKIGNHRLAAQLCAIVNYKIVELQKEQIKEEEKIEKVKLEYGITLEGVGYEQLLEETKKRDEQGRLKYDYLHNQLSEKNTEISGLESSLPLLKEKDERLFKELEEAQNILNKEQVAYLEKYPDKEMPGINTGSISLPEINQLQENFTSISSKYLTEYNQIVGKYEETKDQRDIRVSEQIRNRHFGFQILERVLLGNKIKTLDDITDHLEVLNTELLAIADDLLASLVKVFGKTEAYYDRYKELVNSLNDFFGGKLISRRFYFRIEFEPAPKLDIKWIEHLRKSATDIAKTKVSGDVSPQQFIETFYAQYSGNRSTVTVEDLLNPKRYFVLKARLTDKDGKDIPGSTGESYTAIALLGIARLSIVQDGERSGLRFIILEESATLDNVNFSLFPAIAKHYGYQIFTMTPKPYAIGDDEGWIIHQLIPGKNDEDINYPKTMSYFRTNKSQMELDNYLKARNNNELAGI